MNKSVIDRRLRILEAEGIVFETGRHVGVDVTADEIGSFDAAVLCLGATIPRDLPLPGRELGGIHFAMEFLAQQNRLNAGEKLRPGEARISAAGKHVVVIGGGDTGSDCVGTCNRHKARSVTNFEALPMPSPERPDHQPWPYYPMRLRTSSSHEEGGERRWSILTQSFEGRNGRVEKLTTVDINLVVQADGPPKLEEIPGTRRDWPADLVLLAVGFSGPDLRTIADQLGLATTPSGAIATDGSFMTAVPGIFSAGDAHRGQSLIVWAISEGREAARAVDLYLAGSSDLPGKGCCDLPLLL